MSWAEMEALRAEMRLGVNAFLATTDDWYTQEHVLPSQARGAAATGACADACS